MNPLASTKCASRVLMALAAMTSIFLTIGCGSGGNPIIIGKGGFSNASLSGSYAYTLKGYGLNAGSSTVAGFFVEGGVFTADGKGNITAATDDFVEQVGLGTQSILGTALTGTYSISRDGTGSLQFKSGSTPFELFAITLSNTGDLYMEEADGGGTSAGSALLQDSGQLTVTPSGTFVFRTHDVQVSSTIGAMAISAGAVSGSYIMVQNGTQVPTGGQPGVPDLIGAGTMNPPTGGRGTVSYTVNGIAHSAQYYVVSVNKFLLLDTTTLANILSVGSAEKQSNVAFSAASLSGSYAFGSSGETASPGFINTVGVFTADGSSNIAETYDFVQDGHVTNNASAAWTYLINSDGSGTFSLGNTIQRDIWMVSPTRAYFIALNGTNVEDGTIDLQSGTFTNTSLSTQAAFFMDGFNWNGVVFNGISDVAFEDRVGTLVPSGSNTLGTNYLASFFAPNVVAGATNSLALTGTYAVASNGRTTAQLTDNSGDSLGVVLYLTSNSTGYVLQSDAGFNMSGTFAAQPAP
jgi:hypothetical protein